jgi:hypothetical protein
MISAQMTNLGFERHTGHDVETIEREGSMGLRTLNPSLQPFAEWSGISDPANAKRPYGGQTAPLNLL